MADWVAVLDADVLIRMPDCDLLLEVAETGLYAIRWSPQILAEVRKNLPKANPRITPERVDRRMATMESQFPEALVSNGDAMLASVPGRVHPKDRHVVATALVARANVIVTWDVGHFAERELELLGVLVQPTDEFLLHQFGLNGPAVLAAVGEIVGHMTKTRPSVAAYLDVVEDALPQFGAALREHAGAIVVRRA